MPSFSKKVLSLFLRTRCQKQLHLYLYNKQEREALGMPPLQTIRAGLASAGKVGYEWQDEKVSELEGIFGKENVVINPVFKGGRPGKLELLGKIHELKPFQFIVEAKYEANTATFREAVGFNTITDLYNNSLEIGDANPDIIQILPPRNTGFLPFVKENGKILREYNMEILPNGSLVEIQDEDSRIRLRVIDIKLAAEPGANYFAEVVYYSMSLSAWLTENKLDEQFLVVATPAVWPGSYDASNLSKQFEEWNRRGHKPTAIELAEALEEDIEIAAVDAYIPRLLRLLREQLPIILNTSWDELPYHVNYLCQGCEFLGYPWKDKKGDIANDERHCWPTAERCNHLSRVAGLSSGAARQLSTRGAISNVASLAMADHTEEVFSEHQTLRAKGAIYPYRAKSLNSGIADVILNSGGDALMPRWPNLRLYLFLEYDLSSAITVSFGLRSYWQEPLHFSSSLIKNVKRWNQEEGGERGFQDIFLVDRRDINREREEFLKFLRSIKNIMDEVRQQDTKDVTDGRRNKHDGTIHNESTVSTYQIYLWDEAQMRHLTRLVSRHLCAILADPTLRNLAWLFPPSELLARAEESSRQSPVTFVSSVVQNTVAAPVPHHFTLLEVVRTYNNKGFTVSVHPLYCEPLTDLIPSERIYEYWDKQKNSWWRETGDKIAETTRKKLLALGSVASRLEKDLGELLPQSRLAAPPLIKPPRTPIKLSPQGRLWHEFTRLNAALQKLEIHKVQAMPPREREARFKSAILTQRLNGQERQVAITCLQRTLGRSLPSLDNLFIYKLAPRSADFNAREGDICFALSPLDKPGFLDISPYKLRDTGITGMSGANTIADSGLTGVSITAIDRINHFIALMPGIFNRIPSLEAINWVDLSKDVILDPISQDFLTSKVRITLQAIGYPASATEDPRILEALGELTSNNGRASAETPASRILWQTSTLNDQKIELNIARLRTDLETSDFHLNSSQWQAWKHALTQKFTLIWGPPGTGKSSTLRNIVLAAVKNAVLQEKPLRLLITSGTYPAIDNVLFAVDKMLAKLLPQKSYSIFRLQNNIRKIPDQLASDYSDIINVPFEKYNYPPEITQLIAELNNPTTITILGAPPQQLHNLACLNKKSPAQKDVRRSWFDFVVLDEASQLDVATSTLIFTKVSENGSVVLAGDDLQLPPIHKADAPDDLAHIVGSVYNYFVHHNKIKPIPLQNNYRSNETIVAFTRLAGYDPGLKSHSPDLSIRFLDPIPTFQPDHWPEDLFWTSDWKYLLNPKQATTCFIYDDELSSQVNSFEADAITALIYLLFGRLKQELANEKGSDNSVKPTTDCIHDKASFWQTAVGIITPHRAQQSKIVQRLQMAFPSHPADKIRDAVDTVERFQGQERQVILASFGLGDPDMIQSEDEFLYSLNRFNVLASRARAKLIIFTTQTLVDHLSNDSEVLEESRLLKRYAEIFCNKEQSLNLGYFRNGILENRSGVMKYH